MNTIGITPSYPRVRTPLKPVQVGRLAADRDVGPARENAEIVHQGEAER